MSIRDIRQTLMDAGVPVGVITMKYDRDGYQVFSVDGREFKRPAGEMATTTANVLIAELKDR